MNEIDGETFREEARDLLAELETALLELERNADGQELVDRIFRAMHTIKGSGAMFGFTEVSEFTHEVEAVFEKVRKGLLAVTSVLIGDTLKACDTIRTMLDRTDGGAIPEKERLVEIFRRLSGEVSAVDEGSQGAAEGARESTYRIGFRPAQGVFLRGVDPPMLLRELHQLGRCRLTARLDDIPALEEIDPETCYISWEAVLTTSAPVNAIKDVFIFVEYDSEVKIEVVGDASRTETSLQGVGEILREPRDLTSAPPAEAVGCRKHAGERLPGQRSAEHGVASVRDKQVLDPREGDRLETSGNIRIPSEKLDSLLNLVGELVTVQARLSRTVTLSGNPQLTLIAEEVERLTLELRDNTLNMRMMPVRRNFSKFRRLVRDLSAELDKEVEFVTEGGETELDKTVIDRLNDPLVHIIRNSIAHGIESPAVREASGKPRVGEVRLKAEQSGDRVIITVCDDGAGLDRDAIRTKAVESGLIHDGADPGEKDVYSLVFTPGFSTASEVTAISGRGVGMDVVKKSIEALRGTIDITSHRGTGTVITIGIPLTLAIIESLLVVIGHETFVMPLSFVEECIELTAEDRVRSHGRNVADVRGHLVPYLPLRELFLLPGSAPEIQQVVVTVVDGERVGLLVDKVIGEHQTVIKSLGKLYRNVRGISGATILGDGTVALILDVVQLVKQGDDQ